MIYERIQQIIKMLIASNTPITAKYIIEKSLATSGGTLGTKEDIKAINTALKPYKEERRKVKIYLTELNDIYSNAYTLDSMIEDLKYLNKGKIKTETIIKHYNNNTLGTLLKKYDPIAFYAGMRDYNNEQ